MPADPGQEAVAGHDDAYGLADHERYIAESAYPGRSDFARDRARVLHSSALRRLAAKTQVIMAGQDDFPRTRLTHTLEVAQISRELGASLGAEPDIVDTAGLAHDLGHPPFGHNGEDVLAGLSDDIGGFEGNAQSLRVLTRLEFKVFGADRSVGLNLTRATLDAVIKYPWFRRPDTSKFNAYAEDRDLFEWVRRDAPEQRRCFEAQIMDWADDVAYCVHDLEDAIVSGAFSPSALSDSARRADVVATAASLYASDIDSGALEEAAHRVRSLEFWPHDYDQSARSLGALKNMTSKLIRRFCTSAQVATKREYGDRPLMRYRADLVVPSPARAEVAVLKAITYVHVMRGNTDRYAWERRVISDVVDGLLQGRHPLQPPFQQAWDASDDPRWRLRIVIDQVASLTDLSIVRWREEMVA
jgi:dGTPase